MESLMIEAFKNNGIDSVCEFLMDPVLRDELFEANDGDFFRTDRLFEEPVPIIPENFLHQIDELKLDEFVKTTNSKKFSFPEYFDYVKKIISSAGAEYIVGGFAVFLYLLRENGDDFEKTIEEFSPNDIDIISEETDINIGRISSDDFDYRYLHFLKKAPLNFFPKNVKIIKTCRINYKEKNLREKYLENINDCPLREFLESYPEHIFEPYELQGNTLQFIHKKLDVFSIPNFVEDFDISVSKLVYDVTKDEFIYVDKSIKKNLKKKEATYTDQPFNYFLDRNGIRRKTVKALFRIIKYMDRGFKIKNSKGEYFNRKEIMLEINETRYLQSNNINKNKNYDPNWDVKNKYFFCFYELRKYGYWEAYEFLEECFSKMSPDSGLQSKIQNEFVEKLLLTLDEKKVSLILGPDYKEKILSIEIPDDDRTLMEKITEKYGDAIFNNSLDKSLMKNILTFLIDDLSAFLSKKELGYSISGSSVLSLQLDDEFTFVPNDLDIWLYFGNYCISTQYTDDSDADVAVSYCCNRLGDYDIDYYNDAMIEVLNKKIKKFYMSMHNYIGSQCEELPFEESENYDPSNMSFDIPLFNETFKIQFLVPMLKKHQIVMNPTLNFDMEFCRAYYKGSKKERKFYMSEKTKLSIKSKKSNYTPGRHNFIESGNDLILNELSINRINKYLSRGFELYFMNKKIQKGEDVVIPNGTNENLDYFFLKRH